MLTSGSINDRSLSQRKNSLTANWRVSGYLILFAVICHPLKVAHQELKGVIIVIWEVVDLYKEVQGTRSELRE